MFTRTTVTNIARLQNKGPTVFVIWVQRVRGAITLAYKIHGNTHPLAFETPCCLVVLVTEIIQKDSIIPFGLQFR